MVSKNLPFFFFFTLNCKMPSDISHAHTHILEAVYLGALRSMHESCSRTSDFFENGMRGDKSSRARFGLCGCS